MRTGMTVSVSARFGGVPGLGRSQPMQAVVHVSRGTSLPKHWRGNPYRVTGCTGFFSREVAISSHHFTSGGGKHLGNITNFIKSILLTKLRDSLCLYSVSVLGTKSMWQNNLHILKAILLCQLWNKVNPRPRTFTRSAGIKVKGTIINVCSYKPVLGGETCERILKAW